MQPGFILNYVREIMIRFTATRAECCILLQTVKMQILTVELGAL